VLQIAEETNDILFRGVKFLKKMWCCVGGKYSKIKPNHLDILFKFLWNNRGDKMKWTKITKRIYVQEHNLYYYYYHFWRALGKYQLKKMTTKQSEQSRERLQVE